jgi:ferredoxin-NADP reductase
MDLCATLLPPAGAGAHVLLTLAGDGRRWRKAYSLVAPPGTRDRYEIIVRRPEASRGGSRFLHDQVAVGMIVNVAEPTNSFPLPKVAHGMLLLSAGIGLTPFLSWLPALRSRKLPFELHHVCRPDEHAAFADLLALFGDARATLYTGRESLTVRALLAAQGLCVHLAVCGPATFMDDVLTQARDLGWPTAKLHQERFGAAISGTPFRVRLARSDIALDVAEDRSLLETLEEAGIDAPYLCRGGACGQCRVTLLEGVAAHNDHVLTADERARGDAILTCVSRAQTPLLVRDL